ncbi:hypothetical protein JW766_03160 [Candidatus Dojkabacteria bacterium]|nr:hypothetical protein [Candidatus Dojkabacteria bacterium]
METFVDARSLQHGGDIHAGIAAMDRTEFSNAIAGADATVNPRVIRATERAHPYLRPEWRPGEYQQESAQEAFRYAQMYSWILVSTGKALWEEMETLGMRVLVEDQLRIDVMQVVQASKLDWQTLASIHRLALMYFYSPSLHLDFTHALEQTSYFAQVLRQEILSGRNRRYLLDDAAQPDGHGAQDIQYLMAMRFITKAFIVAGNEMVDREFGRGRRHPFMI